VLALLSARVSALQDEQFVAERGGDLVGASQKTASSPHSDHQSATNPVAASPVHAVNKIEFSGTIRELLKTCRRGSVASTRKNSAGSRPRPRKDSPEG
jgi:hypothetical protein